MINNFISAIDYSKLKMASDSEGLRQKTIDDSGMVGILWLKMASDSEGLRHFVSNFFLNLFSRS